MSSPLRPGAKNTTRLEDAPAVNLLPTPTGWEQRGDPATDDRNLLPLVAQRLAMGLLPTPSTLDSIEARTTYGGGNPTLQGAVGGVSDVDKARHERAGRLMPTQGANLGDNGGPQHPDKRRAGGHSVSIEDAVHGLSLLPTPHATDGTKGGPNQAGSSGDLMLPSAVQPERFGPYAPVIQQWERMLGRPAPAPTEPGKTRPRLAAKFVEWLMGLPDGHVTDVGLTRNQELKALGNGFVPQQGAAALRHLHTTRTTYLEEMTS